MASASRDGNGISIAYLGGSRVAMTELARAMRSEAASRGLESAFGMFQLAPNLDLALTDAGYEMNTELSVVVFERRL